MESYADDPLIEEKTLRQVRGTVRRLFGNYKILQAHNIIPDDIESDVLYYVYKTSINRTTKKAETFLDKMSKIKDEKHFRAYINMAVRNIFGTRVRELKNKPIIASLDYTGESIKDYTDECLGESLLDKIPDPSAYIDSKIMIKIAIDSVENKEYKDLVFYVNENTKKTLETKDIIEWLISERTIKALTESIETKEGQPVSQKFISKEVESIKEQLRKELRK